MNILHKGKLIKLKARNDRKQRVIVALIEQRSLGWNCLVVGGNHDMYKPGGWDIMVFDQDLRDGDEVTL